MRTVRITPRARKDLVDIVDYIIEQNPKVAVQLIDAIDKSFERLAAVPGMGHRRADVPDLRYRFWNVKPYIIAYRFDDESLTVVRVVHGARNFRKLFGDS